MPLDLIVAGIILFIMVAVTLGVGFWARNPDRARKLALRPVDAFNDLPQKAGESVESGTRIHISLGNGIIGTESSVSALAGMPVLDSLAEAATISDKPPIVTTGEGASATLAQNALRRAYSRQNALERYDALTGRMTGPTPLSFAAGAMVAIKDEDVSSSILLGSFGNELGLMADAGWGQNAHQIIGTDSIQGQAAAYVTANEALIGEDVYASGAYLLGGKPFHKASLYAQDIVRLLVVAALFVGAALTLFRLLP